MPELFLEIGCEEIPAAFAQRALVDLPALVDAELDRARLTHLPARAVGTPRRLAVVVPDVAERQPDQVREMLGPPTRAAYDANGNPTKAALGFASKQGVDVSELLRVETPKGEYLGVRVEEIGQTAVDLLAEALPRLLERLPFKKSMRWGQGDARFVRPVHWIVAVLDGVVIPFEFAGITSGQRSRGHRFHAPAQFPVTGFDDYCARCADADVLVDPEDRRQAIRAELERLGREHGGEPVLDDDLLDEVAFLVEKPFAVGVTFPAAYLEIPEAVLLTVMRKQQRYFAFRGPGGKLLPFFAFVAGTRLRDQEAVARGALKVARARFDDAVFYLREDKKLKLADRVESLRGIVFLRGLGTIRDKVGRIESLAITLAESLVPEAVGPVALAARLCKTDLTTGVVAQFPELQGYVGHQYALAEGVDPAVASAIDEHYQPRGASDAPPPSDLGALLSLADKLDSIAGCFRIGREPTGTADPLALRRQSLGVIATILARGYHVSLSDLLERALAGYDGTVDKPAEPAHERIVAFFEGRLRSAWSNEHPVDAVDAVLAAGFEDVVDARARLGAVVAFGQRPDFEQVALTFKRVAKILKDAPEVPVDPSRFEHPEEEALATATARVAQEIRRHVAERSFALALDELTGLWGPVDAFFSEVFVMHEDPAIRDNRLALLRDVAQLSRGLLDFSRLQAG